MLAGIAIIGRREEKVRLAIKVVGFAARRNDAPIILLEEIVFVGGGDIEVAQRAIDQFLEEGRADDRAGFRVLNLTFRCREGIPAAGRKIFHGHDALGHDREGFVDQLANERQFGRLA